jgi:hypothetical protein
MIDVIVAKIVQSRNKKDMEHFNKTGVTIVGIVWWLISFLISVYAVYVSWNCNTASDVNVILKTIYALFAFMFGWVYLLIHYIFSSCKL